MEHIFSRNETAQQKVNQKGFWRLDNNFIEDERIFLYNTSCPFQSDTIDDH